MQLTGGELREGRQTSCRLEHSGSVCFPFRFSPSTLHREFCTLLYGSRQMLKLFLMWFYTFAASKTLTPVGLL